MRTPSTTSGPGRIGASTFDRLITLPLRKEWLGRESDGETSSAGSSMSTSAVRHDSYQHFGARQAYGGEGGWMIAAISIGIIIIAVIVAALAITYYVLKGSPR
jgi:hypothetical protein